MNNTQEITEFDLSLLPGWDEELKCESLHLELNPDCSIEVVARYSSCIRFNRLICQSAFDYAVDSIEVGSCATCGKDCADCWKVTPV